MTINRFCSSGLQAIACRPNASGLAPPKSSLPADGIHVHGAHGRQQDFPQSLARRQLSRRLHQHGLGTENVARKFGITENKPTSSPPLRIRKLSPPSLPVIQGRNHPVEVKITALPKATAHRPKRSLHQKPQRKLSSSPPTNSPRGHFARHPRQAQARVHVKGTSRRETARR